MKKKRFVYPPEPESDAFEDYELEDPFNIASSTDFTGLIPFTNRNIPNPQKPGPDPDDDRI